MYTVKVQKYNKEGKTAIHHLEPAKAVKVVF